MILENGVVRTMDASLARARALAIAGDRIAGSVGTHETALASPDVVDLGGRCVLPGFNERYLEIPDEEYLAAMRDGLRIAAARGVTAVHDKDGWLGALGLWQRLQADGALTLRVWQSIPYDHLDRASAIGLSSRLGDDFLRLGYLKVFMDGTLGSRTALMLDGTGVRITSGGELAEIIRAGAAARWPVAVHAIGDPGHPDPPDPFETPRGGWSPPGGRHRTEHC